MILGEGVDRNGFASEPKVEDILTTSVPWVWSVTSLTQTEELAELAEKKEFEIESGDRDDGGEEGEWEGALLISSAMPLGEDKAAGLLLKSDTWVKSMGQENSGLWFKLQGNRSAGMDVTEYRNKPRRKKRSQN